MPAGNPGGYTISGFGGKKDTRRFRTFAQADRATRPNIIQRAMVALSGMGRGQKNYGRNISQAARMKSRLITEIERQRGKKVELRKL